MIKLPRRLPITSLVATLRPWSRRRWLAALIGTVLGVVVMAVPTDLIDTPLFGREVPPTWWSWPALVASAVLAGLLMASYVREPVASVDPAAGTVDEDNRSGCGPAPAGC